MADSLLLENASVLLDGAFAESNILIEGGRIARIQETRSAGKGSAAGRTHSRTQVLDAAGTRVLPGFIDIHTHGGLGVDFNLASLEDLRKVGAFFASAGVTSFLPCVMTDTDATMKRQLALLSSDAAASLCPQLLGIHLEGPYLSASYKGAMPEKLLRPCGIDGFSELQEAARGKIRLVTLSPELDGAEEFTRRLCELGVRVSLGHSGASYEQAMRAIQAGASSATHVMNAMKLLHMHDPGILTAVLESGIYAEMICDGFHLHPPIVRLLLKAKGLDRMIAVSDSTMAAGLADGDYRLGLNDIRVKDGDAKLASDGTRAGSTLTMIKALRNLRAFTGLALEDLSRLVSENPARLLGVWDGTGSIREGKQADLVLLDEELRVKMTIARGKIAYKDEGGGGS